MDDDKLSNTFDTHAFFDEENDDINPATDEPQGCFFPLSRSPSPSASGKEEEADLPEGWLWVSTNYQLVQSPGGSIHSRKKAQTQEELEQQRDDFDCWLMETTGTTLPENNWAVPSVVPVQRPLPDQDEDEPNQEPRVKVGSKRREIAQIHCQYIGCGREIDQAPLACPSAVNGDPDYPGCFCSYECMAAWACYEVGDPLADSVLRGINHRAGRTVTPAPNWVDTLITGISNLKMTGPIDSKGLRLEEDPSAVMGSRTHEARLLPDNATIQEGDLVEAMEDDPQEGEGEDGEADPAITVSCRLCNSLIDSKTATLRVRLHTCAVWAFCSESCAMDHPYAQRSGFMTLVEWMDLAHKGQCDVLRRETWGTEADDVDPDEALGGGPRTDKQ